MKLFCGATVFFCVGVVPSLGRNHYNDYYDDNDYFTETGFVLTPTDRQARDISLDFPQLEEDFTYPEVIRQERDGGFHGQHGGGGHGRRQGRRFGQQQEQRQDNLEDWMFQQQSRQDRVETTGDSKIEIRNSLTTEIRNLIRDKEDKVETLV